jgi:uncharacterized protein (TIGR00251 family)
MTDGGLRVTESQGRVRFSVRVQPRASRTDVAGVYGDALKVRLAAPPVDGAANDELVEFFANTFAVRRQSVRIVAGEASRSKIVEIDGVTERAVRDLAGRAPR